MKQIVKGFFMINFTCPKSLIEIWESVSNIRSSWREMRPKTEFWDHTVIGYHKFKTEFSRMTANGKR